MHSAAQDEANSKFVDTSFKIYRQWQKRQLNTFPSVATAKLAHTPYDAPTKNPSKNKQQTTLTSQPRTSGGSLSSKSVRSRGDGMDLCYVTERIIALWIPGDVGKAAYRQKQQQAAHMLQTKHGNNYMVFNLSEPRRAARSQHERVRELGWSADLAPPLERLCNVCKVIDSWLSGDSHRIAVLHARGSKDRIGVVIAAYMHYSSICGSADQALDRFAMARFLDDKIGDLEQPSHKRYVEYFSGLLSGSIRINSAPLYLTHVTVLGAPAFESSGGCRAFLKVYEGLVPVYTSGVHTVTGDTRQFTVNVAGERQRRGLQLRGDILLKCYHRQYEGPSDRPPRELIFSCQFHTCAVTDYTLSFTRQELDNACSDLRFPLDGAVELHFSATPEVRLPSPAPTPAVPVDTSDDPVTRWDSYENISLSESPLDGETDGEEVNDGDEVNHTYGPLDGSLYATISKKQAAELQSERECSGGGETSAAGVIGSPHTVSMDSGISSAGNGLLHLQQGAKSGTSPCTVPPATPLSPEDHHRALDELLNDMLLTVENIPDLPPSAPYRHHVTLDDLPPPIHFQYPSPPHPQQSQQQQQQQQQSPPSALSFAVDDVRASLPRSAPAAPAAYSGTSSSTKQLNNGYGGGDTSAPSGNVLDGLDVNFIDAETDENIPYHARQDSRPFTYGAIPTAAVTSSNGSSSKNISTSVSQTSSVQSTTTMLQMHPGLASPSLVRKASFKGGSASSTPSHQSTTTLPRQSSLVTSKPSPPPEYVDSERPSPSRDFRLSNGSSSTSPRSPEFHDGTVIGNSGSLTWLQRQQQKLRERREVQLRSERYPHETRLLSELRSVQQHSHSASHRADGYTSDTTHFADDDDEDFSTPLHINTATSPTHKLNSVGSAPASPLLPHRTSSRRFYSSQTVQQTTSSPYATSATNGGSPLGRQKVESPSDRERPFVAVKRAHEQNRKLSESQSPGASPQEMLAAQPLGLALSHHEVMTQSSHVHHNHLQQSSPSPDSGLLTMVDGEMRPNRGRVVGNGQHQDALANLIASLAASSASNTNSSVSTAWQPQMREDSFSSWRTASISDDPGSPPRSTSPRPQTPAFPVHPRTPYVNNSLQQFDMASTTGLPPKSPTTQRRLSYSGSFKNLRKWPSNSSVSSKDRSPSPVSDQSQAPQHQNISIISNSSSGVSSSRVITGYPTTPHSSASLSDGYPQQSPKSPAVLNGSTGQSSPTVYYGHSRRSSVHSNSEPPQEVSPAHVKFVRDTSRYWYKPTISREEAINMLRDQAPGTFVVRDSNSFPGAFGLALKVATPPPNVQGKTSTSSDPTSELVRHFLIEPTSRGVRLKGCANEPVFSSLSALVYQHSLMPMALPCRLLLPEADGSGSRLPAESPGNVSTAQMLLAQGAACNVLYLFTLDTESLTGPQAIKKAVQQLFMIRPLPIATVVHFKVSGQGITLTDNKRQLFFRRHYPVNTISYCGLDPDDHRWSQKSDETGMPISSNRVFGFVARKPASKTDNQCHIFAELEPEQPASAIVNFVSKVMMSGGTLKANIV
ncbi:tensin-3 isoform X3 [Anabrus simplex]|uniref:tensin-3 isoform X3 n=1 Tax=Anabrus simplex TaxID=316456 RepID=UPI0035A326E2